MPVMRDSILSRCESSTVNGVSAYASAPMRSEKPPRPVRVLYTPGLFLTGVTQVL